MSKKPQYQVNFCITFEVEADDEEDALDKADELFQKEFGLSSSATREFGSDIEEL